MSLEGAGTTAELVIKVNTPSYITIDGKKNFDPVTGLAVTLTKGTSHTIQVDPLHPDEWNERGQRMDLVVEGDQTIECIFTPRSQPEETKRQFDGAGKPVQYGGFWIRFAACLIDIVIGFVIFFVLEYIILYLISTPANPPTLVLLNDWLKAIDSTPLLFAGIGIFLLVFYIVYYTVLESSQKQATFGKQALGLKVVNAQGERLSPGNALVRSCSKILSGLLAGVGFFMISFTAKKQGLHDRIAKTYVVRVQKEETRPPEKKSDPLGSKTLIMDPREDW